MTHLLFRLAPVFFFPVGLTCLLCVAGLFSIARGKRRASLIFVGSALGLLAVSSMHLTCHWLLRGLEGRYAQVETYPKSPAIVIMGGAGVAPLPPRLHPETNYWADRVLYGSLLYRQGLAPRIVVTGGLMALASRSRGTEASINAQLLKEYFGVDSSALILADAGTNTYEDGISSLKKMDSLGMPREIILVTSAAHMARAGGVFRKLGFVVHPAPADFHTHEFSRFHFQSLLPQEDALFETCYALHEYVGLVVYRLMGWI